MYDVCMCITLHTDIILFRAVRAGLHRRTEESRVRAYILHSNIVCALDIEHIYYIYVHILRCGAVYIYRRFAHAARRGRVFHSI